MKPVTVEVSANLGTGLEAGQRNAELAWMEARHSAVDPPQVSWEIKSYAREPFR